MLIFTKDSLYVLCFCVTMSIVILFLRLLAALSYYYNKLEACRPFVV